MANYPQKKAYYDNQNDSQHGYSPFKSRYFEKKNSGGQKREVVKHSGAKTTKYFPKTGPNAGVEQYLTTGWRLAKGELISFRCVTTSKSKLSDKGWFGSVAVTMTNTKTGVQAFHWGTMHQSTGKVVIDSVAMVLNPKAKNGGYAGTYINN